MSYIVPKMMDFDTQVNIVKFVAGHVICNLVNIPGWGTHMGLMPDICATASMYICNDLGGNFADDVGLHATKIKHEVSSYCIRSNNPSEYHIALVVFQHFIVDVTFIQSVTAEMRVQIFKDIWDASSVSTPVITPNANETAYTSQPKTNMDDSWFKMMSEFIRDYIHSTTWCPPEAWDETMKARIREVVKAVAEKKDLESLFRAQQVLIGDNSVRLMAIERELHMMRDKDVPAKDPKGPTPGLIPEQLYIIHDNTVNKNMEVMKHFGDHETTGMRNAYYGFPFGSKQIVESASKLFDITDEIEKDHGRGAYERTFVEGPLVRLIVSGLLAVIDRNERDLKELQGKCDHLNHVIHQPFPFDMVITGDGYSEDAAISEDVKKRLSGNFHIFYSVKELEAPNSNSISVNNILHMISTTRSSCGRISFYSESIVKLLATTIEALKTQLSSVSHLPKSDLLKNLHLTVTGNEYLLAEELGNSVSIPVIQQGGSVDRILPECCSRDPLNMEIIAGYLKENTVTIGYRFYSGFLLKTLYDQYCQVCDVNDDLRAEIEKMKTPAKVSARKRTTPKKKPLNPNKSGMPDTEKGEK